jgi:hypothetical protein
VDLRLVRDLCAGASIVVADEAHSIKNPASRMSMAMSLIKTRARLALTGYPLQNNLDEYYTMINWVRDTCKCYRAKAGQAGTARLSRSGVVVVGNRQLHSSNMPRRLRP